LSNFGNLAKNGADKYNKVFFFKIHKIHHILREKNLEILKFRQCVLAGCQNQAGLPKKFNVPQEKSRHSLLINVEDPNHSS
jgi:hypothetical protein